MPNLTKADLIEINKKFDVGAIFNPWAVDMVTTLVDAIMFGAALRPTLAARAAYIARAIACEHLFKDGNKRSASVAVVKYLSINAIQVPEAMIDSGWVDHDIRGWIDQMVTNNGTGKLDTVISNFSVWLRLSVTKGT